MKSIFFTLISFLFSIALSAQSDSIPSKFRFNADFRARVEQDWNSKKSDGTFRDDRLRYRYRVRAGVTYSDKWYSAGFRIRTGDPNKQQDPQLTVGQDLSKIDFLPIALEKAYLQSKWNRFKFWVGKNTFPFEKRNELFWSDNVYPLGVFVGKSFKTNSEVIDSLEIRGGHFIMKTLENTLGLNSYVQGCQSYMAFMENRLAFYPSFYWFKNMPNIPDGSETFKLDYAILHFGTSYKLFNNPLLRIELDYYINLQNYDKIDWVAPDFKGQKSGFVMGIKCGQLKQKGDWLCEASYAYLQRFAAVDFLAQNDWARWDYSSFNSPDGRLTNYKGIELVAGYVIAKRTSLKTKCYLVEQLLPYGIAKETGSRIRLDLDVKF